VLQIVLHRLLRDTLAPPPSAMLRNCHGGLFTANMISQARRMHKRDNTCSQSFGRISEGTDIDTDIDIDGWVYNVRMYI
jgi:hypothetical protein